MESDHLTNEATRLATAYHEAGHAVVALVLDKPVLKVSIVPRQQYLGQCQFGKAVARSSIDWLEREILIALAGMAAEALQTGVYDRVGAGRDLRFVRSLAVQRASERQLPRYEARMMAKVENLLADEANWSAVQRIATELLTQGTISGRAAKHFYEECQKKWE